MMKRDIKAHIYKTKRKTEWGKKKREKEREGRRKSRNKESWWSISLFSAIFNYPSRSKFSRSVDQQ